jgi:SWI/SNF-related matrix-associated actin-dependent regulator of chromatin subfamily A member 5
LNELFALLNIICLGIFVDYADLDSFLHKDKTAWRRKRKVKRLLTLEALYKILRPFLMRTT